MKKWIVLLALCLPFASYAESFALNFDRIPLANFAHATYKVMLKRDFVVSPDLLALDKPISVSVRHIDGEALPKLIERILSDQGIRSTFRDGVYFLAIDGPDEIQSVRAAPSLRLSGDVASGGPVPPLREQRITGADAGTIGSLRTDAERVVYRPLNRQSEFVSSAINAAFHDKASHPAADMVILTGSSEEMPKLLELAKSIDTTPHKVKVAASFVEVSTNTASGLGISVIANLLGARLGVKIGDTSTGSLSVKGNSFEAVLDVLASDGRFKQVSNPTAVVDDYKKTQISFGDSVPTIGSSTLDKNGNPIQQIVYQQSGVMLDVTPRVLGSGKINVTIDGQVSSFSATTTGVSSSPTLSKRQVQTALTLDDGELLVIGGLNNNKTVNNVSGLSFLPASWSAHSDSASNTDLLLILSATVVK